MSELHRVVEELAYGSFRQGGGRRLGSVSYTSWERRAEVGRFHFQLHREVGW